MFQAKDAAAVTIKVEDVALQKIHVMKESETVMDQGMVVVMMVMQDVKEIVCVEATIARNLVNFTTRSCESRLATKTTIAPTLLNPGSLLEPLPGKYLVVFCNEILGNLFPGQRCSGRKYQNRRCWETKTTRQKQLGNNRGIPKTQRVLASTNMQ